MIEHQEDDIDRLIKFVELLKIHNGGSHEDVKIRITNRRNAGCYRRPSNNIIIRAIRRARRWLYKKGWLEERF